MRLGAIDIAAREKLDNLIFVVNCNQRRLPMRDKEQEYAILTFRCPPDLIEGLDKVAAYEGISRSDVARRAALQAVRAANRQLEGADA